MAETWTPIDDPTAFQDDAVFEIDKTTKSIQVLVEQPIVAGENKSQFIKFQMGRYYDAIDLTGMEVNILYESPTGYQDISSAVNREYSDEYIRFGWIVPYAACPVKGTLSFAVEFVGADYTLKTTNSTTEVLDSISGSSAVPEPVEQTWYIELQSQTAATLQTASDALEKSQQIINALATPQSAALESEMTDPSAVYVYTGSEPDYTYGNWYFHNGSTWVPGGRYVSTDYLIDSTLTKSGQAADAKVVGDALINRSIPTDNAVAGKRVESGTGNITDNVNFSYVEFSVIGGDVIEYKTQRAESGIGLAFYDSDGGYVSGAQAVAGSQEINVPANATLARATYRTVQITGFGVTVCKSIEPVIDAVVGAMVKAESNSKNAENIGYSNSATYNIIRRASIYPNKRLTGVNVTTFVPTFAFDASYFYADIALPENITEIIVPIPSSTPAYNYLVAYTENVKVLNTNYAKLVDGTSTMTAYATIKSDGVHIKAKNLFDAGFARLAIEGLTADFNSFAIHCDGVAIPWAVASLPENGQEKQYAGLSMFASIQCIGDSYTQGGVKSSDGNTWYQAKKPYPQVIADSLGIDVDNFGVGGASVKSYLTNGLANVLSATAPDLYMICFGINDCIHGDTIGTIADISADYTENPNTFYGNYARIIARLKEHAPLARFVIFGRWLWDKSGQTFSNYSNAAKEIAEHFGIPFVDPFDDPFFESYVYHYTMVSGHPTQVTYTGLAYAVIRLMAKCIEENETYYRYAGLEAV